MGGRARARAGAGAWDWAGLTLHASSAGCGNTNSSAFRTCSGYNKPWTGSALGLGPGGRTSRVNRGVVLRPVVWFLQATERHYYYYNDTLGEEGKNKRTRREKGGKFRKMP